MNTLKYKRKYRRRLPHLQPPGATFFITFRLANSIPREVWQQLRAQLDAIYEELACMEPEKAAAPLERERLWFLEFEAYLHQTETGPLWLKDERIAALVTESLHHWDKVRYRLDAYCVMANHVHTVLMPLPEDEAGKAACLNHQLVEDRDHHLGYLTEARQFVPLTFHSLAAIMHSIKRHTAKEANALLNRSGAFWQEESYDHYSCDEEEWLRTIRYVLRNPIKAKLVTEWREWPWSWHREDLTLPL